MCMTGCGNENLFLNEDQSGDAPLGNGTKAQSFCDAAQGESDDPAHVQSPNFGRLGASVYVYICMMRNIPLHDKHTSVLGRRHVYLLVFMSGHARSKHFNGHEILPEAPEHK